MDNFSDKILPNSIESECAVLGCILIDSKIAEQIHSQINRDYFYSQPNQLVFDAINNIMQRKSIPDLALVSSELKVLDKEKIVGGSAYLMKLQNSVSSVENWFDYLRELKHKYFLRRMIYFSDRIKEDCYRQGKVDNIANGLEREFNKIIRHSSMSEFQPMEFSQGVKDYFYKEREQRIEYFKNGYPYPIGLPTLDKRLLGLHKHKLIVIGARPSMGKTAICSQFAYNLAKRGNKVAFISSEMGDIEIRDRIISQQTLIVHRHIQTGYLDKTDDFKLNSFIKDKKDKVPLFLYYVSGLTKRHLLTIIRESGADFIFVDYFQLMKVWYKEGSPIDKAALVTEMKNIVGEYNLSLIVASQLNRSADEDFAWLSNLKGTGGLEEGPDVVLLIEKYNKGKQKKETEDEENNEDLVLLKVAKNRNGETGKPIKLFFRKDILRFYEVGDK